VWLAMVAWLSVDVLADPKGDATGSGATDDGLGSMYSVGQSIEDDGVALGEDDGVALVADDGVALVADDGVALVEDDGVALVADDGVALVEDDGVALGEDDGVALGEDDGVALGEDDGVALVAVDLFSVAVEEGLCTANEPPRNSVQLDGEGDSLDTLYLWYTTLGDGMGRADGDVYNKGCWS
jgi:hypothetical protein